ncbi:hypothetical protein OKA04_09970 [Luteolibacter flavescens]|uniref:Uncharacterized protein n=1 Tax=Luteolibacter flavescens TaxID=1859460 RepID=A0ABT3FNA2_9BACT|nr:hypothetical protein [Luteolibacter flavescens]
MLLALFLAFWTGQSITGFHVFNDDLELHNGALITYREYLTSGHFWQATGENWESEFLQMGAYVILTTMLFQKGSAESNDPDKAESFKSKRKRRNWSWLYRNSLSLAFFALLVASFLLHAAGGLRQLNQERAEHGESVETIGGFLRSFEFWFQSFQNWQSEFLAVLSIVVLSIFLRQDGSPESKDVEAPNSETGS